MKCYNKACESHEKFDVCKRGCADICTDVVSIESLGSAENFKLIRSQVYGATEQSGPDLNAEEPMPTKSELPAVWDLVISDMRSRDQIGEARYATRLQPFNGRDVLVDAYQEALDLAVYLRQAIYERDQPQAEKENKDV